MKKVVGAFIKRFILSNLASLVLYLVCLILLNAVTGGGLLMLTGALAESGWDPGDVSDAKRVFVMCSLVVIYIATCFAFYFFDYMMRKRSGSERSRFLDRISTQKFDAAAFTADDMKSGDGKTQMIAFVIAMGLCARFELCGVSFLSILLMYSQMMISFPVNFLPLEGIAARALRAVVILAVNPAIYYFYCTKVLPRIYKVWASERIRVVE